jgi:hypothetical protein
MRRPKALTIGFAGFIVYVLLDFGWRAIARAIAK